MDVMRGELMGWDGRLDRIGWDRTGRNRMRLDGAMRLDGMGWDGMGQNIG